MSRLAVAVVAGLWAYTPLQAQDALAPTAPVVPAPMLKNGNVLAPAGGTGSWGVASNSRFALTRWSPFRSPVASSTGEPIVPPAVTYTQPLPPLPNGVGAPADYALVNSAPTIGAPGNCAPAGCAPAGCGREGRDRGCWDKFKAWLCYHPSKTDLPKCRPTPYVTPLQGMFPCRPVAGGCAPGCAPGYAPAPMYAQPPAMQPPVTPMPLPTPGTQPPMTQPPPIPPAGSGLLGAGPVMMPPRGTQGPAVAPTGLGRTQPAPVPAGLAGYRFAAPESSATTKPATGPIMNAGYKAAGQK